MKQKRAEYCETIYNNLNFVIRDQPFDFVGKGVGVKFEALKFPGFK